MGDLAQLYDYPEYYEIAFSFRDIPKEVDCFEELFRRFSLIPVKRVLELACGAGPHLEELCRRGYSYVGLDVNPQMLALAQRKARALGLDAGFQQGSMVDFTVSESVDFAYVMLGSLYATSTAELEQHLSAVARTLRKGGLYLLDWCVQFGMSSARDDGETWEMTRNGISVKTTVIDRDIDLVEQLVEEEISLEVDDHGQRLELTDRQVKRAIYPQEFLHLVDDLPEFDFVGWWNNWDFEQPLAVSVKDVNRPIAVIRRR